MAIIASALLRIKSDPLACLGGAERVNGCFAAAGHLWRDRVLDPANTMALFILQVLHGNTAISHLRWLSRIEVVASSYCAARARLPVAGVAAVVEQLSCDDRGRSERTSLWLGRRVLMTDATAAGTPDTLQLQKLWPQPSAQKPGCGFPIVKLLALMDLVPEKGSGTDKSLCLRLPTLTWSSILSRPALRSIFAAPRPASGPQALLRSDFFGDSFCPCVIPIRPLAAQAVAQRLQFRLRLRLMHQPLPISGPRHRPIVQQLRRSPGLCVQRALPKLVPRRGSG